MSRDRVAVITNGCQVHSHRMQQSKDPAVVAGYSAQQDAEEDADGDGRQSKLKGPQSILS